MYYKIISIAFCFILMLSGIIYPQISSVDNERAFTFAVLDLEPNGVSRVESRGLSDKLRSYTSQLIQNNVNLRNNYVLIERTQMDNIFDQFEIQNTGCVSDSCAVEFGKMLQADRILIGTVSLIGQTYSVIARIVDVESGKTLNSADRQYRGAIDDVLVSIIPQVGNELLTNEKLSTVDIVIHQIEKTNVSMLKKVIIRGEEYTLVSVPGGNFVMSATEVNQSQYNSIMVKNPSYFRRMFRIPVEKVNWYDAVKFCNKLSDFANLERCYYEDTWNCDFSKNGFRLPTEDEWEYACRAGTKTDYYNGDDEYSLSIAGWYYKNSNSRTHPVGEKEPNAWGLYDMHGNVWEWCNEKILRGGNWNSTKSECRSANIRHCRPRVWEKDIGFRIVRSGMK